MAPSGPRLPLSEEKIREKSGLAPHRDLAELRSLFIPGTYQEKITHLGNSLMNLTGLKSLDLSRNSLVSLEGIQYLAALESLNLYYNCISVLAEVFRLHSLKELADVDFRLNPVVKNEPDYRLFVVRLLPKLRQLDDRPVRESERKASWLHFASEESLDSTQRFPAVCRVERSCPSRAKCTDPSAKKCLVMDADDEAVLNLIAECEWGLSNPPGSSSQKECESDFHGPQESGRPSSSQSVQHQCGDCVKRGREQRRGGSRGCIPEQRPPGQHHGEQPGGQPRALHSPRPHVHLIPHPGSTDGEDSAPPSQRSSLSAQTVSTPVPAAEKCRKRRLPGGRLQAPVHQVWPSGLGERGEHPSGPSSTAGSSRRDSSRSEASWLEEQGPRRSGSAREVSPKLQLAVPPGKQASLEVALLEALLDLVDRYWSGCKSLHGNEVFLAQARHILSSVEEFTATQDNSTIMSEEIRYLALENKSLQNRLADQQQQYSLKIHEVLSDLDSARKEMDDLRQQLDRSSEENNNLKSLLFSMKKEAQSTDSSAALSSQIPGLQSSVQRLSAEIGELKQHLEHYDKIQELTRMLQESHSSLVSTNEHLLRELGQARAQHRAEVEQLHWSYKELKKTMALSLSPQGSARPGGCSSPR
ncbi:centrosomal protein of 72 kDa isoform X2 [Rousettus aegyptiacus]|uniref:Centrosomal protein of 72 kDa n=1 Tax=Rousettus aegyptiacus TaxID=9407 RepID=A0A7J8EYB0_ROUAE|nr:centrosomal protein of 72 kDa isoform X2 [Rousettus aegyptiacus]KAF6440099.1 centrosomal protein 72 [Rousettus aegyptiacus]